MKKSKCYIKMASCLDSSLQCSFTGNPCPQSVKTVKAVTTLGQNNTSHLHSHWHEAKNKCPLMVTTKSTSNLGMLKIIKSLCLWYDSSIIKVRSSICINYYESLIMAMNKNKLFEIYHELERCFIMKPQIYHINHFYGNLSKY